MVQNQFWNRPFWFWNPDFWFWNRGFGIWLIQFWNRPNPVLESDVSFGIAFLSLMFCFTTCCWVQQAFVRRRGGAEHCNHDDIGNKKRDLVLASHEPGLRKGVPPTLASRQGQDDFLFCSTVR